MSNTLAEQVAALYWFHRIDLGNGIITPGADDTPAKIAAARLPDLAGKTAIEIGSVKVVSRST